MPYHSREKKTILTIISIILLLIAAYSWLAGASSDLELLFQKWVNGGEPVIVRLVIDVPDTSADSCSIIVERYPSKLNPTPDGLPETVAVERVEPGSSIVVEDLVENAPPVKYRSDGPVEYREPQEYSIIIQCYNTTSKTAVLSAFGSGVIEVRPSSPIVEAKASISLSKPTPFKGIEINEVEDGPVCQFSSSQHCTAETGLAVVNSIPGIESAFKLYVSPVPSAMYLSRFTQICMSWDLVSCECNAWGSWTEDGKKLVASAVTQESPYKASGGYSLLQKASVEYRLRYFPGKGSDGFAGICYAGPYYVIEPVLIGGLTSAVNLGPYTPGSPVNPHGPIMGDVEIGFLEGESGDSGGVTGVSTSIGFCYSLGCVSLDVNVYKAGRDDSLYTTPTLVVHDVSGSSVPWYYWWYKGGDPLSYIVEFSGGSR